MADSTESIAQSPPDEAIDVKAVTEEMAAAPRSKVAGKVYVKVKMEGISGLVSAEQVRPGSREYDYARCMLMHDLKAVLEGAFEGGAREIVVYDAHFQGRNIDLEALDDRVAVISGRPRHHDGFFYGLDESFAALFLVGYHARAGTPDALLPHTYSQDIAAMRVNGTELGEIGLEAAVAGEFGVPLAFVSSDSGGVRETRELLGSDVEAVEVKRAITATSGVCLPAARTGKLLCEAARRAVQKTSQLPPVLFEAPATLEVAFRSPETATALGNVHFVERTGAVTIKVAGQNIVAAYRRFMIARNGHAAD